MREDVFKKYYATMVKIMNYQKVDKNGQVRKCVVSLEEAEKNPGRYKIYQYKHPSISQYKFAYDPEIVKILTPTFRNLCAILPQEKIGIDYEIYQSDMVNAPVNTIQCGKELILSENFFAMAKECNVMKFVSQSSTSPNCISATINGFIPTNYYKDGKIPEL